MPTSTPRSHRLSGALPVTVVVGAAVCAAAAISPDARHLLSESFQRHSAPYLELYFTAPASARACPVHDGVQTVDVSVASHLSSVNNLVWTVASTSGGRVTGTTRVAPGHVSTVSADVPVTAGSRTLTVTLAGHDERLSLHCGRAS